MKDSKERDSEEQYNSLGITVAAIAVVTFILAIGASILLTAFTLATLWGWFLVPLGLPVIGYAHAYGLSILATLLRGNQITKPSESNGSKIFLQSFILNVVALCFGYVTLSLM